MARPALDYGRFDLFTRQDGGGNVIGEVHQRWHLWKRNYDLYIGETVHHLPPVDLYIKLCISLQTLYVGGVKRG